MLLFPHQPVSPSTLTCQSTRRNPTKPTNPGFLGPPIQPGPPFSGTPDSERTNYGLVDKNEDHLSRNKSNDVKVLEKNANKKLSNKVLEALVLPSCMNFNPRSIYNKLNEFLTFIKEQSIHCVFISESWERPKFNLTQLIEIEDFTVISNPHQRQGQGGRPALVINTKHFHVRNITNTLISVPWGCEATWAIITPKNVSSSS